MSGSYTEAIAAYGEALELIQGLVRDRPESSDYRAKEVSFRCQLGFVFQRQDKLPEAEREYRMARDVGRTLLASFPDCDEAKQELGLSDTMLAQACELQNNLSDAEVFAQEAIDIFEKQHSKYPSQPVHAFELARAYTRLGQIQLHANKPDTAINWANRSVELVRDNHLESAEGHVKRGAVRVILECRAVILNRLNRPADAAADYLAAIACCIDYEDWQRCLLGRCNGLFRANLLEDAEKSYREAIEAYDERIASNPGDSRFPRDRVLFVFKLGEMQIRGRNVDEGRKLIEEAVAQRERLAEVEDAPSIDLRSRMIVYNDAGIAWRGAGHAEFAKAASWHDKALAECDRLSRHPAEAEFARHWRPNILENRAFCRTILGHRMAAAEDYAAAAECTEDDVKRRACRLRQANELLAAGDVDAALRIDGAYVVGGKIPDWESFMAARFVSLAAAALPNDDPRRLPMFDRSLAYLKQAIDSPRR